MKRILVIDDAAPLRKDIVEMLGFEGYEAVDAEDGKSGVERARELNPDLIICDIMMPGMDGYQVLETLRQDPQTATIPFIFLTAKADRSDVRQGMGLGADDYIPKPFHAAELIATVRARLHKRDVHDRIVEERAIKGITGNIILSLPHELRTPLNVILGFSDLLMADADGLDSERVFEMARYMNDSATRLYHLIENFLVYAHTEICLVDVHQRQSLKKHNALYPKATIEMAALQVADAYKRTGELMLQVQDVDAVTISEDHLKKIVEELVDNAFKFSSANTYVAVVGAVDDDTYRLSVTNRGRGMTPEEIKRIGAYMQFNRRLYEQQGSGLGLVICMRLAQLHGGGLRVESVPDEETTVIVELPLYRGAAIAADLYNQGSSV